jgi:hypothetical protein
MRILSANDMEVAVVSRPFMLDEADFERAGNGAGATVYSCVDVAIANIDSGSWFQVGARSSRWWLQCCFVSPLVWRGPIVLVETTSSRECCGGAILPFTALTSVLRHAGPA